MFDNDLNASISKNGLNFVAYSNANYQYVKEINRPFNGFHVIRDPRDIIVSSYYSSLNSHPTDQWPELISHRKKLQQVTRDEGLFLEMDFIQDVMENLSTWNYQQPNVLELRFEDITIAPYQAFLDIFQFLACLDEEKMTLQKRLSYLFVSLIRRKLGLLGNGKGIPAEALLGKIHANQFTKNTAGRIQGVEDVKNHFRKGIAGDWTNHFTRAHSDFFKNNFGDLVVTLGYQKDNNW
jgi:hypothetical protein